ncbi:hypothetical protein SUVZ_09G1600 [Saccharomyces uvarum]|uniref:Altered inheritance of mitochondria protein 21 n=1 Tax=Saccharomyces uvarum TaxID=230603 RepID=A0ABN8WWN3_SACUV|nr:hypothetical protein SUVZ_09G1600 [Saccharomyces uvarum]
MSSDDIPKIPSRPSRKKTVELSPLPGKEAGGMITNSEPSSPTEKPAVPKQRPILKAKTMTSFESEAVPESLPHMPSQRPIRRSTTEELNNVMNNTSKELEEIESFISRHNVHKKKNTTTTRGGDGEVAAIPQDQQRRPLLSDSDSFTPDPSPREANKQANCSVDEGAVPSLSLTGSSNDEIAKTDESEIHTRQQDVSTVSDDDVNAGGELRKNTTPENITPPVDVSKGLKEDENTAPISARITESDGEAGNATEPPEPRSKGLQKYEEEQENELFENPGEEESISSLHKKLEIENNTEEDLHQGKSSTPAMLTPEADLKVSSQLKSGPENTPVVPQSRPKKDLDSDVKKEESLNQENIPFPEEQDLTKADTEAKSASPKVPVERPRKRAPPPVPKKPSSRIAAFQEMLQKQQQQDLRNNEPSPSITGSLDTAKQDPKPSTAGNTVKTNFTNKLNGLFALPGMVNPGQLPASLGKKLSSPSTESTGEQHEQPQARSTPLNGTRRARGPRGRKLPSKVAAVEKVEEDGNTNGIEIFNTWHVYSIPSKQESSGDAIPDKESEFFSKEQPKSTLNVKPENTLREETEHSSNKTMNAVYPIELEEERELTANVEPIPLSPLPQTSTVRRSEDGSEESLSPADAIASRDQDDMTEILEQQMEGQMESEMETELSGGYEDIDSALHSNDTSVPSTLEPSI